MIDGNRIIFGYGDVCVGNNIMSQTVKFQQFKPPAECGERINDEEVEFIGEEIYIVLKDSHDYSDFMKLLNQIGTEIYEFEFQGYIFDFSKFNKESVRACKNHTERAMDLYFLSMAC